MVEALTQQQKKLAEENHNLIYGFAHKRNINIEKYYDILAIGLCYAAKIFSKNKGEFTTVAYRCMENELYKHWTHSKRKRAVPDEAIISYDTQVTNDNNIENGLKYSDIFIDSHSTEDIVMSNILRTSLLNLFSGVDKEVFEFIMNGVTYEEIAKELGCTRSRIGQRVQRIRKVCANYLNDMNRNIK